MPFYFTDVQLQDLSALRACSDKEVVELCKCTFEYLSNGPNVAQYEKLAAKYAAFDSQSMQKTIEALLFLLIDANKANVVEKHLDALQKETHFSTEVLEILAQYVISKRSFVEGSINSAYIRAYHLVNLEWRLETILATRSSLQQNKMVIIMKIDLHTESKNEYRDLVHIENEDCNHSEDRCNRKNMLVQIDMTSLVHITQALEQMIQDSRSRRMRNIVQDLC